MFNFYTNIVGTIRLNLKASPRYISIFVRSLNIIFLFGMSFLYPNPWQSELHKYTCIYTKRIQKYCFFIIIVNQNANWVVGKERNNHGFTNVGIWCMSYIILFLPFFLSDSLKDEPLVRQSETTIIQNNIIRLPANNMTFQKRFKNIRTWFKKCF